MLTAAACVQVNEAINGRVLECREVRDDICTRMADHIVGLWDPASAAEYGPLVVFTVTPSDCPGVPNIRVMVRCWEVEASSAAMPDGSHGGFGGTYFLRVDGTLIGPGDAVIGNFPVE
jgi:hypothetical protein